MIFNLKIMAKFLINGGSALKGIISASGNKNAVLPLMAACLLTEHECVLENVPQIRDVLVMGEILEGLGAKVSGLGTSRISIHAQNITRISPDSKLTDKLRASVLLLGPLLGRMGKVELAHPGGDIIGKRSIDTHLFGFEQLGVMFENNHDLYKGSAGKLIGKRIFLDETSVTATENLLMAGAVANGTTVIKNAACEPHVICLGEMLQKMGAHITGLGTGTVIIEGIKELKGAKQKVRPDHIEAGTWAITAGATHGELAIENVIPEDMDMILTYFKRMNLSFSWKNEVTDKNYHQENTLLIKPSELKSIPKIDANIWPGFPTDLISPMIVLATQAKGTSLIHDWMYEGRMFFVDKLIRMGADIVISDPHRVVVSGPSKMSGRDIISPDIRAGIALVIAALCADGQSILHRVELIERGYEKVDERLRNLGASIERVEE